MAVAFAEISGPWGSGGPLWVIAVASVLLLVVVLVAMVWITGRSRRQIRGMARIAERLAGGDLAHRFDPGLPHALGELSDSLNRVAEYQSDRIRELGRQQGELQGTLHAMSTGVIAMARDGRVLSMNPAALSMLAVSGLNVRGRRLQEIEAGPDLVQFATAAMDAGGHGFAELSLGEAGQRIVARSESIHDGLGEFVGIVLVLDDVTRLRQLEHMRVDFAANVSHELRTPITSIHGYAELMMDEKDETERTRYAEVILRNTASLSSIIDDLLSLARLEDPLQDQLSGREQVKIHELLDEVVRACSVEAEKGGSTLKIECHEHLECHGNRQLLEQAVTNLVVNAIRYGPQDSPVTLSAESIAGGQIQLSVADRGVGIEASHHGRIFERFYRVDKGRSREVGGTGLGLAIVKHIALAHGGRVELESAVGQGSVFRITLPMAAPTNP
ncbi:MAG: ATP-binding protein [Phycisphaerales bacterium]|jgi:two-component system phosphate regulon sensor histidine kinase PhoR|nr:ATP-binding protein [Phycisphaerales bacterium]